MVNDHFGAWARKLGGVESPFGGLSFSHYHAFTQTVIPNVQKVCEMQIIGGLGANESNAKILS